MKLKLEEAKAILAGHHPEIVREGTCPFEKGEVISLRTLQSRQGPVPQVSITITAIRRGKKGEHMPEYSVRDDRGTYLRHRGGTTRSPSESVDPEASLVDAGYQRALSEEGRLKTVLKGAEQRQTSARERKELRIGSNPRAERAVMRHQKAILRAKVEA
jgi:hypothetical protein